MASPQRHGPGPRPQDPFASTGHSDPPPLTSLMPVLSRAHESWGKVGRELLMAPFLALEPRLPAWSLFAFAFQRLVEELDDDFLDVALIINNELAGDAGIL